MVRGTLFLGAVKGWDWGVINAGSLVCQRIAAGSAVLSVAKEGGQQVSRLARGESTKRSRMTAEALTGVLRERGVEYLAGAESEELWLILGGSELRKRYAQETPFLMQVRDLNGELVAGYRTLNVLGITPSRRGVLYHRLFSTQEEDFDSESRETQQALQVVSEALGPLKQRRRITWILDSGFDDVAVWRTIWEQEEHVLCRLKHQERLVEFPEAEGQWVAGNIREAQQGLKRLATAQTEMVVRRGRQTRAKGQPVPVAIRAGGGYA